MLITLGGSRFDYLPDVKEDRQALPSFYKLAKEVFDLHFDEEPGAEYLPHALLYEGQVVANVSVNLLSATLFGEKKRLVQLGTVMTAPAFRGRGLCRFLLTEVLNEWRERCDIFYLFANDSVLDFYPRFGFFAETEFLAEAPLMGGGICAARRLDTKREEDYRLLQSAYRCSNPFSAFTAEENETLLRFYCRGVFKEQVFYLPKAGVAAVMEEEGGCLVCHELFGAPPPDATLFDVLRQLAGENTKTVRLGFTPQKGAGFTFLEHHEEDTTLFLLKGKENPFSGQKLRFPSLSHA